MKRIAKPRVSVNRVARLLVATLLTGGVIVATLPAGLANPKGGQVTAGSATISNPAPALLDIVQSTNRAVIDWQSFDIAAGERTIFQQPSAASITLNRVLAANPSMIAGQLSANGSLVLINPSGVVFSKGAQVNVNSIIATPSDISNANFMAGRLRFDRPSPNPNARIVNAGTITVAQKGLAALVAPSVANSGVIAARLGKVVLGGAETFTVDFYGDGLINFDVGPNVTAVPLGPNGKPVTSLVSNTGAIDAPGGTVLLTADAAAGILANVVDSSGRINAPTTPQGPGTVIMDAGAGNGARLAGTIDVSGASPGQRGGTAIVTGGTATLAGTAQINARGSAGGGAVKIGGGPHGTDPSVRNAQTTYVAAGASIDASATDSGNGGNVAVWSDGSTVFNGTILAKGGPNGGNGGWVETSGKATLDIGPTASVNAAAPQGLPGSWLLDPNSNVDITAATANDTCTLAGGILTCAPSADTSTVAASAITSAVNGLGAGDNVIVTTTCGAGNTCSGAQAGTITLDAGISWTTAASLTLSAASTITINQAISATNAGSALVLTAGGAVSQTGAGTIHVDTLTTSSVGGTTLNLANTVSTFNATNTTSGGISLTNTASPLTVTGISQTGGGGLTISNTGALDLTGPVSVGGAGAVSLTGTTIGLNFAGTVVSTAGGGQTYSSPVLMQAAATLSDSGDGAITFSSTLNGASGLTVNTAGTTSFFGAVGGTTPLASLTTDAPGTTVLNATSVKTSGGQTYSDPVTITTGSATLTSTGGGGITFANTLNGPTGLLVNTAGATIFDVAVGGTTPLISVTTDAPGTTALNGGSVKTTGAQDYRDPVTLGATSVLTSTASGNIVFENTLNGGFDLTIDTGGQTSFFRAVGGTTPLASVTTDAPGTALLNGFSVKTTGAQTYNDPVTITTGSGAFTSTSSGNITFANTVDGFTALSITTAGTAAFSGAVGGTTPLASLSATGGTITLGGTSSITSSGALTVDSTGIGTTLTLPSSLSGTTVKLQSAGTISQTGGMVTATALTGSAAGGAALNKANAVAGLGSFTVTGGDFSLFDGGLAGTLTVSGPVSATNVTIAGAPTLSVTGSIGATATDSLSAVTIGVASGGNATGSTVKLNSGAGGIAFTGTGKAGQSGGIVDLDAAGNITEAATSKITAGTLESTGGVAGSVSLLGTGNSIAALGTFPVVGGDFALLDGTALTVSGTVSASTALKQLSLQSANGITIGASGALQADAASGLISLQTDSFSLTAGGMVSSATVELAPSTVGGSMTLGASGAGLSLPSLTGFTTGNLIVGAVTPPGGVRATTAGSIAIGGALDTSGVSVVILDASGAVTQTAALTGGSQLSGSASSYTLLNAGNGFSTVVLTATAGHIQVADGSALNLGATSATGNIYIASPSTLLTGVVSAGGTLGLQTDSFSFVAGSLTGSTVELAPLTSGTVVTLGAAGGLSLLDSSIVTTSLLRVGAVTVPGSGLTTTAGSINVGGSFGSGALVLELDSLGTIGEAGGAVLTAGTLSGSSAGGTSLTGANLVTDLGPFSNTGAGGFALTNAQALSVNGAVDAGTGALALTTTSGNLALGAGLTAGTTATLISAGTIDQTAGIITASTLTGSSVGGASLTKANLLTDLGAFTNTGAGGFALTNAQALTVNGAVDAGTAALALKTTSGDLALGAGLTSGTTATLISAGTIDQTAGIITASTLTGSSAGAVTLTKANKVNTFGPFTDSTASPVSFTDAQALTVGNLSFTGGSAGDVTLTTTGAGSNLILAGAIGDGSATVTLNSAGTISESGGAISAGLLSGSSVGGASFTGGNNITTFGPFTNSGSGLLSFTDFASLTTAGTVSSAGDLTLTLSSATSALSLDGNVTAGGTLLLTVTAAGAEPAPTITQSGGNITASDLVARIQPGAGDSGTPAITLNSAGNAISGDVTLTTLNVAGTALGSGTIGFTDSTGFTIASQPGGGVGGAETGIGTIGTATLHAGGAIAETGIITATTLTGSSVGGAALTGANLIGTLGPFSNTSSGLLSVTNAQALATTGTISSAGNLALTTTAGGLVLGASTLTAGGGLITLTSAAKITQGLTGVIDPNALLINSVGSVSLIGANTVDLLAASITGAGSSLTFNNTATTLAVDTVTAVNGITTNGGAVSLTTTTSGDIVLNQPIAASGATPIPTVSLTSAGSISEALSTGKITASSLSVVDSGGQAVLEATNAVGRLAASLINAGSAFTFNDGASTLIVGTVTGLSGITTNSGDVNLKSGGLTLRQAIAAGSATARLVASGAISQNTSTGAITAGALSLTDSGGQAVLEASNAVGKVAASLTKSGSAFTFDDGAKALIVGAVGAAAAGEDPASMFSASLSGITTKGGDVNLKSGGLTLTDAIKAGSATVRLMASKAISQNTTTGAINAGALSLTETGGQAVLEASNAVGTLAASLTKSGSALTFNDGAKALVVGAVGGAAAGEDPASLFGTSASGIKTKNGDINLKSGGLTLTNAVGAGSATVRLVANGAVAQNPATGAITAGALALSDTGGQAVLDASNAVGKVTASLTKSGSAFTLDDGATALIVGSVAAPSGGEDPGSLFDPPLRGITTKSGDVNLKSGGLRLTNAIGAGNATVRLVASGAVSQKIATGAITAGALSLTETGGQAVLEASNAIGTLAASLTKSGSAISFNDGAKALIVGAVGGAAAGEDPASLFGTSASGITTKNGDVNLKSGGLSLTNAVGAGSATVRLVANGAISQNTATGAITAGALALGDTEGQAVLEASNAVGTLAADLTKSGSALTFNDGANALVVGAVTGAPAGIDPKAFFGTKLTGITTKSGDVNLNSGVLTLTDAIKAGSATVRFVASKAISQNTATGAISAGALSLTDTGGWAVLEASNAVGRVAASLTKAGSALTFNDGAKALVVGAVGAAAVGEDPALLFGSPVSGITTKSGDVDLKSGGLRLSDAVGAGSATVRLVASGAISQKIATGAITAGVLALTDPGGQAVLEAGNAVGTLAASLTETGSALSFNDGAKALVVGSVAGAPAGTDPKAFFGTKLTGITTKNGDVNLNSGVLTLTDAIKAGSATVRLVASGAVSQNTTRGAMTAGALALTDTGGQAVLEASNAIGTLAASLTKAGSAFSFNDNTHALIVGKVAGAAAGEDPKAFFGTTVTGIATSGGDVNLKSGALTLTDAVTAGSKTVRLVAGGAIAQNTKTGAITAGALSLSDTGGQVVLEASNAVGAVAANLTNSGSAFSFKDSAPALTVGSIGAAAAGVDPKTLFGATVTGIATKSGDVNLKSGRLTLTDGVGAGSATVRLVASGAISQNTTRGAMTAGALALTDTGGQAVLEASNAIGTLAANLTKAGSALSFNDGAKPIIVGAVAGASAGEDPKPLFSAAVTGITTKSGDVNLNSGALKLTDAIGAGSATVRLVAKGPVSQNTATGAITAGMLSLNDPAGQAVLEASNAIGIVAASLKNTGSAFTFNDGASALSFAPIAAAPSGADPKHLFGPTPTGITTTSGDINLRSGGLTLNGPIDARGAAVRLVGSGIFSQAGGSITASSLALSESGSGVVLAAPVATLAAAVTLPGGGFTFTDTAGLTVGTVAAAPMSADPAVLFGAVNGVTTNNGPVTLITSGALTLGQSANAGAGAVTLTSGGTISQALGIITASTLSGSSVGGTALNDANLLTNLGPFTNTGAGGFALVNAQGLNVTGSVTAGAGTQPPSGNLEVTTNGALTLPGSVTLSAGNNVVLASNGGFVQSGTLTITNSADLVIDTTGQNASTLLTKFLAPNSLVIGNRDVITGSAFAPGGTSNPITFEGALAADHAIVLMLAGKGSITGGTSGNPTIDVTAFGVSGAGGSAALFGSVDGDATKAAAQLGKINPRPDNNYRFNDCVIGSVSCIVLPTLTPVVPQAAREIDVLLAKPPDEDIDAPLINIFDEERLCERLLREDPERAKAVCR